MKWQNIALGMNFNHRKAICKHTDSRFILFFGGQIMLTHFWSFGKRLMRSDAYFWSGYLLASLSLFVRSRIRGDEK